MIHPIAGYITLHRCKLDNNSVAHDIAQAVGGGGLYIDFNHHDYSRTVSSSNSSVIIQISNCTFIGNYAKNFRKAKIENTMFGQGGGISVVFRDGFTSGHSIEITGCVVSNNTAQWGGGLFIMSTKRSIDNTVSVSNSVFTGNTALNSSGGGTFLYITCAPPTLNLCRINNLHVEFINCDISENTANHGGGSTFVLKTTHSTNSHNNTVVLDSCRWNKNGANSYGAAVDITTEFISKKKLTKVLQLSNGSFVGNYLLFNQKDNTFQDGRGALMITSSSICLKGYIAFINNNGSAVYAISSEIRILKDSRINFTNNTGRNGGALVLVTSYLHIRKSVYILFSNNTAFIKGGAIYSNVVEIRPHQVPPYNCFLQSEQEEKRNITLEFEGNKAECEHSGMSIYTTSLQSCITQALKDHEKSNISIILSKIANFKFLDGEGNQVITSEKLFFITEKPTLHLIPGKKFELNITSWDEFRQVAPSNYRVYIPNPEKCAIGVDRDYKFLPNGNIRLYGTPGESCNINIEMEGSRVMYITQNITLAECPPGLILRRNATESNKNCTCPSDSTEGYSWILNCDKKRFQAYIVPGMWAGYIESKTESDETLQVAYCPSNFCIQNSSALPDSANKTLLEEFICREGRTGVLCGKCRNNYSVYYHSPRYNCMKDKLCSFGWLFYIVSEMIPLVTIFVTILTFKISFTSGALTGFLFYAQIIDILDVAVTSQDETYPKWTVYLIEASNFVYSFFSLNPFDLESLSFCLWKGASTLDIITFKFVTIAFAFFLVQSFYWLMNINFHRRWCRLSFTLKVSTRQTLVHGITAFLVICLVQTIKVSFYIFSSARLYEKGNIGTTYKVYYQGDINYFGHQHLRYLLPASLFSIIIVIIPTSLLLWYPLGPNLLSKCGLNETKFIQKTEKLLLINRLKPVIDSFQGCYKDKFRFFAGLLFLYRITILANISFSSIGFTLTYVLVQAQLTVMLLIHALVQPYKKKIHNILDSLLLSNLALTNMATIFIRHGTMQSYQKSTNFIAAIRALLTTIPLLCFLFLVCKAILLKIIRERICVKPPKHKENTETDLDIPFRLLNDSECDDGDNTD